MELGGSIMKNPLNIKAAIGATIVLFIVSYLLCVGSDLLFGWTMYQSWMPLYPGFTWPLTAIGFLIGLLWVVVYSVYVPMLFILPYNYFVERFN